MLGGETRSTCEFHLLCYLRNLHLNTIFDAKSIGYVFHGVWGLEMIECMLFLPISYALDFYTNGFTKEFFSRTLLIPRSQTIGLEWRPVPQDSIFATEWSLIYVSHSW